MRVHALSGIEIGIWLGLIVGLGGGLGAYLGGVIGDHYGERDERAYLYLSAIVSAAGVPFAVAFLLLPNPQLALLAFIPFYVMGAMYVGALWSLTQGLVRVEMRATASAILLFILNLVGLGVGPLAIGMLNDSLAPRYGDEAIRYSLLVVALAGGLGAVFFLRAVRTLREDLAAARS